MIILDSLDPLTEITQSGQAFSHLILLERILWLMIGFFFFGAISRSIIRGMRKNNWFGNNLFISSLKTGKGGKDKLSKKLSDEDK